MTKWLPQVPAARCATQSAPLANAPNRRRRSDGGSANSFLFFLSDGLTFALSMSFYSLIFFPLGFGFFPSFPSPSSPSFFFFFSLTSFQFNITNGGSATTNNKTKTTQHNNSKKRRRRRRLPRFPSRLRFSYCESSAFLRRSSSSFCEWASTWSRSGPFSNSMRFRNASCGMSLMWS